MEELKKMPKSLYGMKPNEILGALGLSRAYQGKQVYQWLVRCVAGFEEMTDLPKALREEFASAMPSLTSSNVIDEQTDSSGATKLGIELHDGAIVECVLLTDKENRKTACLSSQVGCAMGCTFCRTGTMGLIRNLQAFEIIEQFVHLRRIAPDTSHIVFMGMGEPMANFAEVIQAITYLHDPDGFDIGLRRITISTSGVIPGILKLAELNLPVKLAVSLVTADNRQRTEIMPVNKAYPLDELKKALLRYQHVVGKRFTLEYVMLHDQNTDGPSAKKLANFIRGLDVMVNLIPWNPAAELPWETPGRREIDSFTRELDLLGVPYTRRFSRGRGVNGACGQLAVELKACDTNL
ncbi:23S rRNA (adenine(2503)-C(2))-methyltransferase RlmN [Pleomorphochaeta sp. DL1XJH-081]|uniref:23S rRNA (adenine(2503)-C(2))-methyltransferase RlmN n=1 Tax=Pleomorphochaeta sp. DL1XJH-081 TaxID=3409690 RepID=UPI003BB746AB